MWMAWIVGAIALGAAAFMLRFLMALLREGAPSVCYWVAPLRREPLRRVLAANYPEYDCRAPECNPSECNVGLLENENYAKEDYPSGLIALDVHPVSNGLVRCSIYPWGYVLRGHGL
jgi:hypothetical protein